MEIVFTVIAAVLAAAGIVLDISWLISIRKAEEKAFVGSLTKLIIYAVLIVISAVNIFVSESWLFWLMIMLYWIAALPAAVFTVLSPEGVRTFSFRSGGIIPLDDYRYQFVQGKSGRETLELHRKASGRLEKYQLGIKNIRTVKILADYYPKFGYENPLLK